MPEDNIQSFKVLGCFLQIARRLGRLLTEVRRFLSTNWPHEEKRALTLTTVCS